MCTSALTAAIRMPNSEAAPLLMGRANPFFTRIG
jgi:hypothetical protein